jgi:hypothetical protein
MKYMDLGAGGNPTSFNEDKEANGLTGLVLRCGLAKNTRQAEYVLLTITLIGFAVICFFLVGFPKSASPQALPPGTIALPPSSRK